MSEINDCVSDLIAKNFKLPEPLVKALEAQASKEQRTQTNILTRALWQYLQKYNCAPPHTPGTTE